MFSLKQAKASLLRSELHNEQTFYDAFIKDMQRAKKSIIIESPFITKRRLDQLMPYLKDATKRGVRIVINTRDPISHDESMRQQAADGVGTLQDLDITVLYTGNLHRKLAMIDNATLWEGSLNILSQSTSSEIMRRTSSPELCQQVIKFTRLTKWYL
jgi:phosphatidylserine/phosphatidylglycerophosphate/cardiolipin synthase-like enzyme